MPYGAAVVADEAGHNVSWSSGSSDPPHLGQSGKLPVPSALTNPYMTPRRQLKGEEVKLPHHPDAGLCSPAAKAWARSQGYRPTEQCRGLPFLVFL